MSNVSRTNPSNTNAPNFEERGEDATSTASTSGTSQDAQPAGGTGGPSVSAQQPSLAPPRDPGDAMRSKIQDRADAAFSSGSGSEARSADQKSSATRQTNTAETSASNQTFTHGGNQGVAVQSNDGPSAAAGNIGGSNQGNGGIGSQSSGPAPTTFPTSSSGGTLQANGVTVTQSGSANMAVRNQGNGGAALQENSGSPGSTSNGVSSRRNERGQLEIEVRGNGQSVYVAPTTEPVALRISGSHNQVVVGAESAPGTPDNNRAGSTGNVNSDRPGAANNNNNNNNENHGNNNNNNDNNNNPIPSRFPGGVQVELRGSNNQLAISEGAGAYTQQQNGGSTSSTTRVGGTEPRAGGPATGHVNVDLGGSQNQVVINEGNDGAAIQRNRA